MVPAAGPLQALMQLPGGMKLTLLSPMQAQLDRLKPVWDAACRKAGIVPGAATAADITRLDEVEEPMTRTISLAIPMSPARCGALQARPLEAERREHRPARGIRWPPRAAGR